MTTSTANCAPNGEPSTNDFQVFELVRIVDRFAVEFDDLPQLITGRDDCRVLVMSGTPVAGFSGSGERCGSANGSCQPVSEVSDIGRPIL